MSVTPKSTPTRTADVPRPYFDGQRYHNLPTVTRNPAGDERDNIVPIGTRTMTAIGVSASHQKAMKEGRAEPLHAGHWVITYRSAGSAGGSFVAIPDAPCFAAGFTVIGFAAAIMRIMGGVRDAVVMLVSSKNKTLSLAAGCYREHYKDEVITHRCHWVAAVFQLGMGYYQGSTTQSYDSPYQALAVARVNAGLEECPVTYEEWGLPESDECSAAA